MTLENKIVGISFELRFIDWSLSYGHIDGHDFIYNIGCDVYPRFREYKASEGEILMLKKMIDAYISSDAGIEHRLALFNERTTA